MSVDAQLIRNHVLSLHVPAPAQPLTPKELHDVSYLAQAALARLLSLPVPKKPGVWSAVKRFFASITRAYTDRRASQQAIKQLTQRVALLEGTLEDAGIDLPTDDQAGKRRMAGLKKVAAGRNYAAVE